MRLQAAGVNCSAVAFASDDPRWSRDFAAAAAVHSPRPGRALHVRITAEQPVALDKAGSGARRRPAVATALQLPSGGSGVVGAALAPPHNERDHPAGAAVARLAAAGVAGRRASRTTSARRSLLELLGNVASQHGARARRRRNGSTAPRPGCAATWPALGRPDADAVRSARRHAALVGRAPTRRGPRPGAPAVHEASEIAQRVPAPRCRRSRAARWWALPLFDDGEPVAVLVARNPTGESARRSALAHAARRRGLAEPLLRHWREAERSLVGHALDERCAPAGASSSRPGHLTWKLAPRRRVLVALAVAAALAGRRSRHRQTWRSKGASARSSRRRSRASSPQALVRPGERVARGQLLARLDDRDLEARAAQAPQRARPGRRQAAPGHGRARRLGDGAGRRRACSRPRRSSRSSKRSSRAQRSLAPIEGLVVSGDWVQQIGGPVEAGKEMFEIAATDGYRVVLHVPDHDIARVRNGQAGALRLTGAAAAELRVSRQQRHRHGERAGRQQRLSRRGRLERPRAGAQPGHAGHRQDRRRRGQPADGVDARRRSTGCALKLWRWWW